MWAKTRAKTLENTGKKQDIIIILGLVDISSHFIDQTTNLMQKKKENEDNH